MSPKPAATETVDQFLAALDHPFKKEILAVRKIILSADASISEGIKWNAPSFSTAGYFATFHLRAKDCVQVILHLGAKTRATAIAGIAIKDPESLLEWLAKDRATVKFRNKKDIETRGTAFRNIIREWIQHV